jgi:VWFA-related protein
MTRLLPALFCRALLAGEQSPANAPLVNLTVTAVDSSGQPVSDLRADDIQILDNGKPRKVVWLHALPRKGSSTLRSEAAKGAREHSNRGVTAGPSTFILFDLFNADLATRGFGATEITRVLERLESSDTVYLYLLDSKARLFVLHGVAATNRQNPDSIPWTRRIKPLLDQALQETSGMKMQDDRYTNLRIGPTWQALSGLAAQTAQVPGPKSFLWITQGVENGVIWPGGALRIDTVPLRDFAANLNALETAVYSVEQRPPGSLSTDNEGSPGDTLEKLSALTGGRRFPSGATEDALAQAMSGAQRMNYRMAFSPDRMDGKYHKLRVTTARTDIKIQTAQGYYAAAVPNVERRDAAIMDAFGGSPFEYPEIGLAATMAKLEGAPGQARLTIRADAPDVLFVKQGTRYKARLVVELARYGSSGLGTIAAGIPVNLDMSEEDYAKATTSTTVL